jgi:hypothetical protein
LGQSLPMGLVWLSALLYKMGKVRVLYRKPQPSITTHNNQHEPQLPYPPAALPSLSPWSPVATNEAA